MLTCAEVSELLGFQEGTLRDWARDGRLPVMRIAGAWRFDPADLAAWLKRSGLGVDRLIDSEVRFN
jgi:excisionase family DNA binding protein